MPGGKIGSGYATVKFDRAAHRPTPVRVTAYIRMMNQTSRYDDENERPPMFAKLWNESPSSGKLWMKRCLIVAAVYNIAFGVWAIFLPSSAFDLAGMARPNYPELWQCIGMIVGVYGLGYGIAAFDPVRHWPIVLVGFLGKIFGPVGFLQALVKGSLPLSFGGILITNDLIWWLPFAGILAEAYRDERKRRQP